MYIRSCVCCISCCYTMAEHVAEWQILDNKAYARRDIYHYAPSRREAIETLGDIPLNRCRLFPARFGGPVGTTVVMSIIITAVVPNEEVMQKADNSAARVCRIFSQAGYVLGEFAVRMICATYMLVACA